MRATISWTWSVARGITSGAVMRRGRASARGTRGRRRAGGLRPGPRLDGLQLLELARARIAEAGSHPVPRSATVATARALTTRPAPSSPHRLPPDPLRLPPPTPLPGGPRADPRPHPRPEGLPPPPDPGPPRAPVARADAQSRREHLFGAGQV